MKPCKPDQLGFYQTIHGHPEAQHQEAPMSDAAERAIERLRYFEPPEGYYLAFSGGKDSIVIHRLAELAGVRFDAHHSLTTIDPPELVHFIRQQYPQVQIDRPNTPLLRRLSVKGFPLRQRRWCCEEYKERGGTDRVVVTGIRKAESNNRSKRQVFEHCMKGGYKSKNKRFMNPIIDWTDGEVWSFIRGQDMPYCELYDQGWKRIGCLFCPMQYYKRRYREAERYPRYKRLFIKAFEQLHATGRDSMKRWATGEDMFWWWLGSGKQEVQAPTLFMEDV
tara:strand:+ start:54 stop:887 length:834 start_codon:yes stop_codon:yes gene_type:complete